MTTSRWLRMGEACRRLSVCRRTMRKYCVDGVVLAEKLPGSRGDWRIREDSLDALLSPVAHTRALDALRRAGA